MFLSKFKVLSSHGKQYIDDLTSVELTPKFRGRPVLTESLTAAELTDVASMCPTGAISTRPFSLDMGKCVFCGECAVRYPSAVSFLNDYKTATNLRDSLIIRVGEDVPVMLDSDSVRSEIRRLFGRALKLREVSAGGDNSCEMELNATMNVNFDFSRYGVEFVASPRHADGVVVTGPITHNMAAALEICYKALPSPKIVILAGTDAISGGLFAGSTEIDRSFLDRYDVDLYVPGNPVHPLTFINGVMQMIGKKVDK